MTFLFLFFLVCVWGGYVTPSFLLLRVNLGSSNEALYNNEYIHW